MPSAVHKVEHLVTSLPPDVAIPITQNAREEAILESATDELIQDAEELMKSKWMRQKERSLQKNQTLMEECQDSYHLLELSLWQKILHL